MNSWIGVDLDGTLATYDRWRGIEHIGDPIPDMVFRIKNWIANGKTVEEIRDYLEIDSLQYLSLDGMLSCLKHPPDHYCTACWSGKYPIPVDQPLDKYASERYQMKLFDE